LTPGVFPSTSQPGRRRRPGQRQTARNPSTRLPGVGAGSEREPPICAAWWM